MVLLIASIRRVADRFRQSVPGVDFLGYVSFPHNRLVRTKTRRRIFKKFKMKIAAFRAGLISENALASSLSSYLGVLSHADAKQLAEELENLVWFSD